MARPEDKRLSLGLCLRNTSQRCHLSYEIVFFSVKDSYCVNSTFKCFWLRLKMSEDVVVYLHDPVHYITSLLHFWQQLQMIAFTHPGGDAAVPQNACCLFCMHVCWKDCWIFFFFFLSLYWGQHLQNLSWDWAAEDKLLISQSGKGTLTDGCQRSNTPLASANNSIRSSFLLVRYDIAIFQLFVMKLPGYKTPSERGTER